MNFSCRPRQPIVWPQQQSSVQEKTMAQHEVSGILARARFDVENTASLACRPRLVQFIAGVIVFAAVHGAAASELRLLSANVFTGVLDPMFGEFERSSGHTVSVLYETAGKIKGRVESGVQGDVVIVTRPLMEELEKKDEVVSSTVRDMARSQVALVVRRGAARPDVGTVAAFRRALVDAKSISYPDPTRGGATGVLVTAILKRLDVSADIAPKTRFPAVGHFAVELVAAGKAEMAIAQPMEALLQPGVEIVGYLPSELQEPRSFTFAVGQMSVAKQPTAAVALIRFLVGPSVQSALKSKGMEAAVSQ
jgi:molybdate transport system substrate-binding protein